MLRRSLHHGLVSSSCGSFIRKALAVILHPLMLSGLGTTATPSRVKDVITNSAALQVVRARLIACLDFSALITGLLIWHLADDSLQPEQQGCYPECPSWFQPREHLWDRVACMSDARGLLQFCRFCSLMSDKAPVCLWGAASFGLRQQASGAACRQWLHVAWAGSESVGRTFCVFYPTLGDQCSALLLSVFMWVGPLNRTCTIWISLSSLVPSTTVARADR